MDVLTFETCWAVNGEIIKRVTSSWSIFIQSSRYLSFHVFLGMNGTMKMQSRSSETMASIYNTAWCQNPKHYNMTPQTTCLLRTHHLPTTTVKTALQLYGVHSEAVILRLRLHGLWTCPQASGLRGLWTCPQASVPKTRKKNFYRKLDVSYLEFKNPSPGQHFLPEN